MRIRRLSRKSVLVSWTLSYIELLAIILAIASVIYFVAAATIQRQILSLNRGLLEQTREVIDGQIEDVRRLALHVSMDSNVKSLMYAADTRRAANKYDDVEVVRNLRMLNATTAFVDEILIYFARSGQVYGSSTVSEAGLFHGVTPYTNGMDAGTYLEFLRSDHRGELIPFTVDDGRDGGRVTAAFVQSFPVEWQDEKLGTILVVMNRDRIGGLLRGMVEAGAGEALILRGQEVLFSTAGDAEPLLDIPSLEGPGRVRVHGEEAVALRLSSRVADWGYLYVVPTRAFLSQLIRVRNIALLIFGAALLCGMAAALHFSRRNYVPVADVIRSLGWGAPGSGSSTRSDEFSFIQDSIAGMVRERTEMLRRLELQKDIVRNRTVVRALKGLPSDSRAGPEPLTIGGIGWTCYLVAVLVIERDGNAGQSLTNLMLREVLLQNLGRAHAVEVAEADEATVCIISPKSRADASGLVETVVAAMREVQSDLVRSCAMRLTISLSSVHGAPEEARIGYAEALEGMESKLVSGAGSIIRHDESSRLEQRYFYPIDTEHKLINFVRSGDFTDASLLLDTIFERNFRDRSIAPQWAKCLIFNLVGTIAKASRGMDSAGDPSAPGPSASDLIHGIAGCETLEEARRLITATMQEICASVDAKKESHNGALNQRVLAFIDANYRNCLLNAAMIGDALQMSPAYLARFFHEQNGQSIAEYVQRARIVAARELLVASDLPLGEIATRVGYTNVVTFMRVFKKREAITPGTYRNMAAGRAGGRS